MSDPGEPRRWVDGAGPPGMEELLRAARKTKPTITEVGRVGDSLGVKGAGTWASLALTSGVVALALLTAVGGVAIVSRKSEPTNVPTASSPEKVPQEAVVPAIFAEAGVETAPSPLPEPTVEAAPKAAPSRKLRKPSELDLLRGARTEIVTRPKSALIFLERHKSLYPDGILAEEREALLIAAYRALGKKDTAEKKAAKFSTEFPESPHDTAAR